MVSEDFKWYLECTNVPVGFTLDFLLKDCFTVGRDEDSDFVVKGGTVSRKHCEFFYRQNKWYIRDLVSRNGVYLNNQKIPAGMFFPIVPGDVLGIGSLDVVDDRNACILKVSYRPMSCLDISVKDIDILEDPQHLVSKANVTENVETKNTEVPAPSIKDSVHIKTEEVRMMKPATFVQASQNQSFTGDFSLIDPGIRNYISFEENLKLPNNVTMMTVNNRQKRAAFMENPQIFPSEIPSKNVANCSEDPERLTQRDSSAINEESKQESCTLRVRSDLTVQRIVQLKSELPDPVNEAVAFNDIEDGEIVGEHLKPQTSGILRGTDQERGRKRRFCRTSNQNSQRQVVLTDALPLASSRGTRRFFTGGARPIPVHVSSQNPQKVSPQRRNSPGRSRRRRIALQEQMKRDCGLTGFASSVIVPASQQPEVAIMSTEPVRRSGSLKSGEPTGAGENKRQGVVTRRQQAATPIKVKCTEESRSSLLGRNIATQQQSRTNRRRSS